MFKKPRKALVIIDMQHGFRASRNEKLITNICREIKKAKAKKQFIIVVEYANYGVTKKRIRDTIGKYRHKYRVIKYDDDGGDDIVDLIDKMKLPITEIGFCGVNTSYCVEETLLGTRAILRARKDRTKIFAIKDACNCVDAGFGVKRYYHNFPAAKSLNPIP